MRRLVSFLICAFTVCVTGSVGAMSPGAGATQESVLYSFGGLDGAGPLFGVVGDGAGDLFGSAIFGGSIGHGAIFELTPGGSGYLESLTYNFHGTTDGEKPNGIVRDATGRFFGFTAIGGGGSGGTVFKLDPSNSGYRFTLLYSFGPSFNQRGPLGPPVIGKLGAVYGVTQTGVVFKLTPAGQNYTYSVVYTLPAGNYPQAPLAMDAQGTIYGTTYVGGNPNGCSGGCGEVFKITQTRTGYRVAVIYRFQDRADGFAPFGQLAIDDATGVVYGTTQYGGKGRNNLCGTVFKLTPTSHGYVHEILYSFNGPDGCLPEGRVLIGKGGDLFGTVAIGGRGCGGIGCGVVYELIPSGGGYLHINLYDFLGPSDGAFDGAEPQFTALVQDASGAIYGTTRSGGSKVGCYDGGPAKGCGVVFKIVP